MKPNVKKTLIAVLTFLGGLVSGLLGAPYAGLVSTSTTAAVAVVEAIPEKPVEAPKAAAAQDSAETPATDAVAPKVEEKAPVVVAPVATPAVK